VAVFLIFRSPYLSTVFTVNCTAFDTSMDLATVAYGLCVAAGGVAGYMKAGSTASLAAGLTFGGVAILGAYLVSNNQPVGHYLVVGTAGTLTGVMGRRFMNSGKIMPAGVVTILSVAMLGRYAYNKFSSARCVCFVIIIIIINIKI